MEHFPLATEGTPGGSCREMERENNQQDYSTIKVVYLGQGMACSGSQILVGKLGKELREQDRAIFMKSS
jgi:hypothetical protein